MTAKFEVNLQMTHNPPKKNLKSKEICARVETKAKAFVSNQQFPKLYWVSDFEIRALLSERAMNCPKYSFKNRIFPNAPGCTSSRWCFLMKLTGEQDMNLLFFSSNYTEKQLFHHHVFILSECHCSSRLFISWPGAVHLGLTRTGWDANPR